MRIRFSVHTLVERLPKEIHAQAVALLRDIFQRAVKSEGQAFNAVRLRIAQDQPDPKSSRPERDEIFLDALAGSDSLGINVPRRLRELIGGNENVFMRREWSTLALIAAYWIAVVLIAPWPSSGPLTTAQWLPLAFLPLVLITLPAARFILRRATRRSHTNEQALPAAKR